MTREEYLLKVLYDHNKPKSKQTGSPEKYPQGFFNAKNADIVEKNLHLLPQRNCIAVIFVRTMQSQMHTISEYIGLLWKNI